MNLPCTATSCARARSPRRRSWRTRSTCSTARPRGDGAAAVLLTTTQRALDLGPRPVRVRASAAATDALALHNRPDLLRLEAAARAARRAFEQAEIGVGDLDLAELHDSYTVLTALQLEAIGAAARGEGWRAAAEGGVSREGALRSARSRAQGARNPLGATGVYQRSRFALQLRGEAGANQVPERGGALALNLGGLGGTAVAHVFEAGGIAESG